MNEIHITTVAWVDGKVLRDIRQQVFIDEQHVPEDMEWDSQDEGATHFLLFYQQEPVATARLLGDGHIGRVAVLSEHRSKGLGAELMQHIIRHAHSSGMQELHLSAQTQATDFYNKLGFSVCSAEYLDAGIPHQDMCWQANDQVETDLPDIEFSSPGRFEIYNPQVTQQELPSPSFDSTGLAGIGEAGAPLQAATLVDQCRRRLRIYSPEQARWLFNRIDFISACERLIARDPKAKIQILLQRVDSEFLQKRTLLSLAHRFPSLCEIRCQHPELMNHKYVQLMTDAEGFLMLPDSRLREGFVRHHTPDQVKRWASQFDELWASSQSDPAIRRFLL
ncbi:MAG TPA: GNAT family N-acetyltransferase [Pseudomonas sabulinigri]|uniref:N-acetyltransferase domain-containing protein n=1 Tax=marine sediment metagenome TaxID=412755 RepID=A0A0F9VZY6_9ZZZZ|nr:GNAT family N-acetyltransferase [Halopseudomonas sabulinigri]HEC50590.1 GNAT family N-acetyltransferase [Halopseudomonas sabulinigri]